MNKNFKTIGAAALAVAAILAGTTSCADERENMSGQGHLTLSTSIMSDVKVASRASTEEELAEKAIVWISNSKGAVRKYNGLANVPAEGIDLLTDHYIAEVWTGDSVSASFDSKWFKGREEFDIVKDQNTNVNIRCKVANTVVSVVYKDGVDELLKDYTMTVGHARGDLVFEGRDERKGYFMMPSTDKNIKWNLQGTLASGTVYTRSGVIENVKPATEYIITVGYTDNPSQQGGGYFTINIDERTIDVNEEIIIKLAPQFEGYDFDFNEGITGEVGKLGRHSVLVRGVGNLTSVILRSDALTSIIGGNDIDLLAKETTDAVRQSLIDGGINFTYSYNEELDASVLKANFEETFLNGLKEGEYDIVFTATDTQDKTTSGTLHITATNAPVRVNDVILTDVWATSVTLHGDILQTGATNPGIAYRVKGATEWAKADVSVNGTTITAAISGLRPGTEYEYTAIADGYESPSVKTFVTETASQLPNASFEEWQDSSAPFLVYASGGQMFWDTGNHGSSTMGKNVTEPATDKVHAGSRSIKLSSQFVGVGIIGKFAAGNVFVGKYLETTGTDGVLGWGRPWTSRPKALKGWMHYTPAEIGWVGSGTPSGVAKGDMDTAIIYIAILDSSTKEHKGENFPVIVKTKSSERTLFNKNDSNVIAYGELVISQATNGDALVEFTIPIEYYRTDLKASNIMITAAASRYGDYFTGGNSVLYLDDLQLVY